MSYLPSSTPIPPNSQSPNTARLLRSQRRAARVAVVMARGRSSNLQQQPDLPSCGNGQTYTLATLATVDAMTPTPAAAPSSSGPLADLITRLTGTTATSASQPVAPGSPSASPATTGNLSQQDLQDIADAPEMVTPQIARVACAAGEQDKEPSGAATVSPPWANARVAQPQSGVQSWIKSNPLLALVILAAGGVAVYESSK